MTKRLTITFIVSITIFILELSGGIISRSLALLSDSGHVFTDAFAIGLTLIAHRVSKKPSDFRATFGYHRFGIITALINGVSLIGISFYIFYESYHRFVNPTEIDLTVMIIIACIGLMGNLLMATILHRGHEDLNIKSAWLHVISDTLSSLTVIISGLIIYYTGWRYIDLITALIIGVVIILGGIRVIKEAIHIFLEFTPPGFNTEEIAEKIRSIKGVIGIHDLHLWAITHNRIAFSAHIWVHDQKLSEVECIRKEIEDILKKSGIHHIMLQFECYECMENGIYCRLPEREND